MLQTKPVEKIKTHFVFKDFALRKSCFLWDYVEEYGRARPATDDSL